MRQSRKVEVRRRSLVRAGCLVSLVALSSCSAGTDEEWGEQSEALCGSTVVTASPGGPVNAGTSVTVTATKTTCGAAETPEYQFYYKRENTSDAWTLLRAYGTNPTVTWNTTGLRSGRYQVLVYTRSVGSTGQSTAYLNYFINDVCMSGTLTGTPASPQAPGTVVSLNATGACSGSATPEFHFLYKRQDQTAYTELAPYGPSPVSWNTTGLPSGTYNLWVQIRGAGNASSAEGNAYLNYLLSSTSCGSVTSSASPASPQLPGTSVSINAAATCSGGQPEYTFYYRGPSDSAYQLIRGYGTSATAAWNTLGLSPGTYSLLTQVRAVGNASAAEASSYLNYKLGFTASDLVSGAAHTCVLLNSGVKCFGRSLFGAPTGQYSYDRGLEAADMGDALPAVSLGTGRTVKAVARGAYHACAILDDGGVKCWGRNSSGGLGLGDTNHRSAGASEMGNALSKVNLGTGRTAKQITAGAGFTCAVLDDNSVKCWGDNTYGNLGLGDVAARGDAAGEMGSSLPVVNLGTGRTATKLVAGPAHVCAILDNGSLKCWGLNNSGQLGLGDINSRGDNAGEMGDSLPSVDLGTAHTAKAVTLGVAHTCATLEDDTLKCWGQGANGALGLGDTQARGDGPNEMGNALPVVNVGTSRKVKSVVAGGGHTCAILDNDALKCWGLNSEAQLGLGDMSNRGDNAGEMGDALPAINLGVGRSARKILATYVNTCVELDLGALKCWGASYTGTLGIGPSDRRGDSPADMGDSLPSFSLGASAPVASFGSGLGYHYGCALLTDDTVKCWGSNSYGQLGVDRSSHVGDEPNDTGARLSYVNLGSGAASVPVAVAAGEYHSCALLPDGRVKCWGANAFGTSGLGDTQRHDGRPSYMGTNLAAVDLGPGKTAKKIYSGAEHSCAILNDDTVKCWGQNTYGQLGLGDTNDRGDASGEMGAALPVVQLGAGRTVKSMSLGYRHSCAVLDNGALKCWGWNGYGQLGLGSPANKGQVAGEMGDSLPAVNLGTGRTAVTVIAGFFNTCAILDNGALKCWGDNKHGQLGYGDTLLRGTKAAAMGDNLPVVNLGTGRTAKMVGIGISHTCALLDNQTVKCWGYNSYGKLGYGDTRDRGVASGEMGDNLAAVDLGAGAIISALSVGWDHNCALVTGGAGSVRCWGNGDSGELGYGDNVTRGDNSGEMGSALPTVNLGDP